MTERIRLNGTIHGDSGVGKSWLLATMPPPRLILDAEGGSRFAPATPQEFKTGKIDPERKILWDPYKDDPPKAGKWKTCIVITRTMSTLDTVYQWLASGRHAFNSCGLDQLTEIQARMKAGIKGRDKLTQPDWDEVLRGMQDLVRQYRDLVLDDAEKPLEAVLFAAGSKSYDDGKIRPMLQGAMREHVPYFTDLVGYLKTAVDDEGGIVRRMLIQPYDNFVAKDRTHTLTMYYGPVIENPNIVEMLAVMNGELDDEGEK